jgi:hypothetical protein
MKRIVAVAALFALALTQIDRALSAPPDPWKGLAFLEGTWDAHAQAGSAGARSNGTYTFEAELKHHVLVRRSHLFRQRRSRNSLCGLDHSFGWFTS